MKYASGDQGESGGPIRRLVFGAGHDNVECAAKDSPPDVVSVAMLAAFLAPVGFGLTMLMLLGMAGEPGSHARASGLGVGGTVLFALVTVLGLGLGFGIVGQRRWAWLACWIFALLGLLVFPLGTLVWGIVLGYWFRPETKRWFEVER